MQTILRFFSVSRRRPLPLFVLVVAFASGLVGPVLRAADSATLSGTVNNSATGNLLQGAKVEIPSLSAVALADHTGRYVLSELPAGTYDVVVSYTGLDTAHSSVAVSAGQRS